MKILWIANMLFPDIANYLGMQNSPSGTWMEDLSKQITKSKNIELAVAAIGGDRFQDITIGKIRYFLIPGNGKTMLFYNKGLVKYWRQIYNIFRPDIVHLHGTEYSHGLSFLRTYPRVKAIVSIQGIISKIKNVALEGIPLFSLLRYRTFRENIKLNGMIESSVLCRINARYEREILKRTKYANVVNYWDKSFVEYINPELQCFQIDYNLRELFYSSPKWNIQKVERFTIFTNPGGTPVKGLHILLKALHIVKKSYPNVKLFVPGMAVTKDGQFMVVDGYAKYIRSLIRDLELNRNVVFLGRVECRQLIEAMLKSHVVVIPSAVEGTSLMLREAMFLGVPSIASFRGGMADFISDKKSGYLYDFPEFSYLAHRIIDLFKNDSIANGFSKEAIIQAERAHNRKKNPKKMIEMYRSINERKW